MATIDDKVVSMSFESSKFERGVDSAITAIEKLKKALTFPNAGKGLEDLDKAGKGVDLSHIGKALDDIKGKFSALSVAALAVFANIATKAVSAAGRLAKAFTLDPIIQGFHEYETQLNAVQTILSNTRAAGTKLSDVNKVLDELNTYADKTIYNFSEMTRNIGTFTAAGVDLKTAAGSIKGIANLAALSGSNSQQASSAMYQLSQAISAGRVSLQDWNSVVNAGMGGTVFQRALAQTAEHMGTLKKGSVELKGAMKNVTIEGQSFRQSIQAGPGKDSWLTGKVLTTTLRQLSGDLTDAQLKAQGYTDAQIKAIQSQAKMAEDAATQVKTMSQLIETTKEALGSGWAKTWQIIFGDFGEAKKLFTGLSNAINGFVGASADARNKVLQDWKDLGGRTLLLDSLKNAFHALVAVIKPIKDAFRDIFPAKTGQDLFNLTKRFHDFTEALMPGPATIENLRRTFRGLFALLDIGKQIISGIFSVFGHLFETVSGGSGGFLDLTGSIGDFLVRIDEALKKGGIISGFFEGLGKVLAVPIELIQKLAGAIADLFSQKSSGGVSGALGGLSGALAPLAGIIAGVANAWDALMTSITGSPGSWIKLGQAIGDFFSGLGSTIGDAISGINWDTVLAGINTGLFAGLVLLFKNFFGKGSFMDQFGGGILKNISGSFKALEGSMVALQQNIKAKTLKEIAIAIGILAASLFVLSLIDPQKLQSAMTGMTIAFGELIGAMALLEKVTKSAGFIKMPIIGAGLIALSFAILMLSLAVRSLAGLSWEELAKGLGGIGVLLVALSAASGPLSKNASGMIQSGIGIAAIAIALKILASAVADFGSLSWTELAKGMSAVAAALVVIGGAARLFPPNMVAIGVGLIAVGAGLKLIASVVAQFGGMDWRTIGKGMIALGAALVIIGGAMQLMPAGMIAQAAGLLIVAAAITIIARAIESMGGMSIGEIAKGLITLGIALALLAAGLYAMEGGLPGAAALIVAAAGIAILAPAIATLGGMGWVGIIKAMVALAAAIAILAAASILLAPAIPTMIGLGAALVLIGAGLALAGAGVALLGIGLAAIASSGSVAIGVLLDAIIKFEKAIPEIAHGIVTAMLAIVTEVGNAAPKFVAALGKILTALLDAIVQNAPKIAVAFGVLIDAALKILRENYPKLVAAGFQMLMQLLVGIRNNIPRLVSVVTQIIITFINALSANIPKIATAAVKLLTAIVTSITGNLNKIVAIGYKVIAQFVVGMANNWATVITAAGTAISKFVGALAGALGKVVTAGANAIISFATGLGRNAGRIVKAAVTAMGKFITELAQQALKLINTGAQAIVNFLDGLEQAIHHYVPIITQKCVAIGAAIISGVLQGLAKGAGSVIGKMVGMVGDGIRGAKNKLQGKSPSRVFMRIGKDIVDGLVIGIDDNAHKASKATAETAQGVIDETKKVFKMASPSRVMQQLGEWVGEGFANGIKGSTDDVQNAFAEMESRSADALQNIKTDIAEHQARLDQLKQAKKKNVQAINDEKNAIKDLKLWQASAADTQKAITEGLVKERRALAAAAKDHDFYTQKLEEERNVLNQLITDRTTAAQDYREQYGELPELSTEKGVNQLTAYTISLTNQASAVAAYSSTLDQLRELGIDDATYKKLLREGTADQQFASELLAGGKAAVENLNQLDAQLDANAAGLGQKASHVLFDKGIEMQQQVVNGFVSKQAEAAAEMAKWANTITDVLVKAMKKKLKAKSPSQVFRDIGIDVIEGFAIGLESSASVVTSAVDTVGSAAMDALKSSMSDLSTMLTAEIDAQPTITPVLDLTQVRSDAQTMANIFGTVPLTASTSSVQAASISAGQATTDADVAAGVIGTQIRFEQNNYSPESLSAIEIYRQTRNQLAQAQLAIA